MLEAGRWFALAAAVAAADQWTKHLVQQALAYGESVRVTSFFDLVLVFNPGAAFSLLSSASGWQRDLFIVIALAASAFMTFLIIRHRRRLVFATALALILGGAIGNLIDRFLIHAVVDFLHFHIREYSWPAFNLADSAITCGAGLLILDSFLGRRMNAPAQNVR
ncbi:MAG: signal peptidase II [Betaproteobacteria bacterium]|nr:signal peptidase II [Betaproteobacteria bacterium]